jgi:hypothetical protein
VLVSVQRTYADVAYRGHSCRRMLAVGSKRSAGVLMVARRRARAAIRRICSVCYSPPIDDFKFVHDNRADSLSSSAYSKCPI